MATPVGAIYGPKVMLINEYAGSGGDVMPWLFRREQIGPLIGKRTWGGLVGMAGAAPLMDGGFTGAPRVASGTRTVPGMSRIMGLLLTLKWKWTPPQSGMGAIPNWNELFSGCWTSWRSTLFPSIRSPSTQTTSANRAKGSGKKEWPRASRQTDKRNE